MKCSLKNMSRHVNTRQGHEGSSVTFVVKNGVSVLNDVVIPKSFS